MGSLPLDLDARLREFLAEDLRGGDVTAAALVPAHRPARAELRAKAAGVIAGVCFVERLVRLVDPQARVASSLAEGACVRPADEVAVVEGDARALLAVERTALNLVQRLSGIATLTARFVAAVAGTSARILDTRKTAPGLRFFDKWAVLAGGGENHRSSLHDQVLIKSNHLRDWAGGIPAAARAVEAAVRSAQTATGASAPIEIEVLDRAEALRAAGAGARLILLDNFTAAAVAETVVAVRQRYRRDQLLLEASGGIDLGNVRAFAEAGVDRISIGALTHSAPALDLSLTITPR